MAALLRNTLVPLWTWWVIYMIASQGVHTSQTESNSDHQHDQQNQNQPPMPESEDVFEGDGSGEADEELPGTKFHNPRVDPKQQAARDVVDKFLSIVEQYDRNKENCTPGTEFNLGEGVVAQYGVLRYKQQALVAVNRANFLTRLWRGAPRALLENEYVVFTAVRSMVEGDPDLFAAGNCYDYKEYKNFTLYCPYAYRLPNDSSEIMVKDLSVEYMYLGNGSEFFYQARVKAARKLKTLYDKSIGLLVPLEYGPTAHQQARNRGYSMYRYNDTCHGKVVREDSINILYEDGHWSKPYFDCGGGDIWMMTYTVPFFGYKDNRYHFKGTSGIDIDLQKVDIDQCPTPEGSKVVNVFAGSDKCKKETSKCVPVPGLGFRRGSYKCACKDGFYFPDTSVPVEYRYYNGSEIEHEYERKIQGLPNMYAGSYYCLPCAPGCETCIDASPCILTLDWVQRSIVLGVSILVMSFIPVLIWFTIKYRDVKVLKAASPVLLRIILLGALLLYCPMIVQYFEPTELNCSLRLWMREIGFSISYGALLLKTWRISVVFRVRSAQRVKISDTDLMKRLMLIVLCFAAYLSVRMVVGRPRIVKGRHSSSLHTFQCSWDIWDYCAAVAELLLLLWGIRLCIVVRKAPSEFNESRFISWAIYNETLLSLFLNITMFFLQSPANPDLLYLVLFIHSQLTTTVTLAFLFGSKAYHVFKHGSKEQPPTTMSRGSKYMAAPKSVGTVLSTVASSGNTSTVGDKICDELEYNSSMEKDVQEEFKRLYMQLELLKQKNMKLGNPHLTYKLSAMTEAAMREEPPDSTPHSPNMNGKRVVINLDEFKDSTSL